MRNRVCVVTGASRGIGLATAEALTRLGARVVLVCRDAARGRAALAQVAALGDAELVLADLSSREAVREAARTIGERHSALHALVLNAGVITPTRLLTASGWEAQLGVNHLAPFLLTHLLLDRLRAGAPSRVVVVASQVERGGRIEFEDLMGERRYDPLTAYRQSKLANVMFALELAERLTGSGVTVNALHPGVVRTRLLDRFVSADEGTLGLSPLRRLVLATRRAASRTVKHALGRAAEPDWAISSEDAARTVVDLVVNPRWEATTGAYVQGGEPVESSPQSRDPALRRRLWDVSAKLTGLDESLPPGSG